LFTQLLQRTAQALSNAGIPFAIMGGQAVLLYGEPRLTKDVDVSLGLTPDDLDRVLKAAVDAGWQVLTEDPKAFVSETFVLPVSDRESGIRIDLIFSFTPFEREAIEHAVMHAIGGVPVPFVRPEDLLIHKIFAGRPRDLEDARTILQKQSGLDMDRVTSWLSIMSEGAPTDYRKRLEDMLKTT